MEEMKQVCQRTKGHSPKPMTIISALFRTSEEVDKMDLRLKVSREEKNLVLFLIKHRRDLHKCQQEPGSLKPFTDFIIDVSPASCVFYITFVRHVLVLLYFSLQAHN